MSAGTLRKAVSVISTFLPYNKGNLAVLIVIYS
jgi:hypothetical protein